MSNDLLKYGIVPHKTGKEYISNLIPKEYLNHFIRGCFDGDGSVFISNNYLRVAYYGSHQICQEILNIFACKNKVYDKTNVSFFSIQNKKFVLKFYNYIYKDATIFMKRKKIKFDNYFMKESC